MQRQWQPQLMCWLNDLLFAISQTLCPSEIWFVKKLGNMVCLEQRNPDAEHEQQQHRCDHLSSPATAAGWRGGEGCSHPAAHQIGRSTISNSAGNSWDIFINVLKVFRRSVMQCCQWIAPPSWARLDCRHCIQFVSSSAGVTSVKFHKRSLERPDT